MRAAVLLAFFLSGASSLLFESLWTRELTLVFGSTTLAISTVLAAFMGGLGLGSFLVGRRADRLKSPLRTYGLVEGGVGLYALVVPILLAAYPALARWLYGTLGDHYVALSLGRFVAAAALLGLPTTLMGATLPLLARHFIQRPAQMKRIGWSLGTLYAVNTFGALTGAFCAGFIFLPLVGVKTTNYIAAGLNLVLCGFVLVIARMAEEGLAPIEPPALALEDVAPEPPVPIPARAVRVAVIAFGISGATAMTLEVLWTRALAVVIGSSIYSFTLILIAFLGGLAGGSKLLGRVAGKTKDPVAMLGLLHFATAAGIALTYTLVDKLPRIFVWFLRDSSFDVDAILWFQFLLALVAILPAAILMGGVFPLTMRIYAGGVDRVGRDVGTAYAVNTLGAIVGSFLAGFVALPVLGLQRGIFVAGALDVLLGAALLWVAIDRRRVLALAVPVAFAGIAVALPRWNLVYFDYGLFRVDYVREILQGSGKWVLPDLLYYKDGIATTVSVERFGKHTALKNNGKVDASNGDDMPTQIMVGLMPFFFAKAPAPTVAIVGYGSGVTAGATTQSNASRIDVVELEPAVVEASRFFSDVNHDPPHDPRVHIHTGDGRNFLAQTRQQFDVIISEPSNPWITGVSNLFTSEYWAMAHKRLAPHGIFCQWAQLYEMSSTHIKTILRTFDNEFPYTYVFAAEDLSSDVILVASDEPLRLDRADLARRMEDPRFRAEAARGGVKQPEDLMAYLLLGPAEIPSFTAGVPINTDDNAIIEFGAPRDLLGYNKYDKYLARVYGEDWPYGQLDPLLAGTTDTGQLAKSLLAHGKVRLAMHFIERAGKQAGEAKELAELLANDPKLPDDLEPPKLPTTLSPADQEKYAREYAQVEHLVKRNAWSDARKLLSHWPPEVAEKSGNDLALLHAYICWHIPEEYGHALDLLDSIEEDTAYLSRRPEAMYLLGRAYYTVASYAKGVEWLDKYRAARAVVSTPVPTQNH